MKKIKFVYYRGHVCRVLGIFPDYDGAGDRTSLMIECTVVTPSYQFVVTKKEYQIAGYWD